MANPLPPGWPSPDPGKVFRRSFRRLTYVKRLDEIGSKDIEAKRRQLALRLKTLATVLRYTHIHGAHIDQAIRAIGRGIPEPAKNETGDTVTPKLHTVS